MMMSCKQMTHLMSQRLDRPLKMTERLALRLHTMVCSDCRNFESNLAFLRRVSRHAVGERSETGQF